MSLQNKNENLNDLLKNLESISGIIGSCLVKNNGILITSRLPREIDSRKFGALAATMFGSMETATSNLGDNIYNLTVEFSNNCQLIVLKVSEQMLIVSLMDLNVNLGVILIEIDETIKNIKDLIKE